MSRSRRNPEIPGSDLARALAGSKDLSEANLGGADLRNANLRSANLQEANLAGANLEGADLSGAYLRGANLLDAYLRGANLYGANLQYAALYEANLRGANLQDANLYGAYFYGADLEGANLRGTDLRNANLRGANLQDADFSGAYLYGAYLYGANLQEANLAGANLTGIVGLDGLPNPRSSVAAMARSRRNPFFVSPGGAAAKVSDADFEARKFPRLLEREVEIEGFDPNNLPPGFTVQKDGSRYLLFFQGRDTGLYAMDPRKASEIASRKGANVASGTAPKAAAGRPSGMPGDRDLFGVGRDELVRRSRAGDSPAGDELRLRGRDPLTGAKTEGLASRLSKAVANGRRRR